MVREGESTERRGKQILETSVGDIARHSENE